MTTSLTNIKEDVPTYKLRAELMMLKAKKKQLQLEYENKSTIGKLYSLIYSYSHLMYLKLFNRNEYDRIMRTKEIVDYIEKHDLAK
jgi:hypothetical protein